MNWEKRQAMMKSIKKLIKGIGVHYQNDVGRWQVTYMRNLKIDPELKSLIPPLAEEEYQLLEQSILQEGCRDALVIWQDTIIDGHNRYEICNKHGIAYITTEMEFDNICQVKEWMINNQFSRRNLPLYQRVCS